MRRVFFPLLIALMIISGCAPQQMNTSSTPSTSTSVQDNAPVKNLEESPLDTSNTSTKTSNYTVPLYPGIVRTEIPDKLHQSFADNKIANFEGYMVQAAPVQIMTWYREQMPGWVLHNEVKPEMSGSVPGVQIYRKDTQGALVLSQLNLSENKTLLVVASGSWPNIECCSRQYFEKSGRDGGIDKSASTTDKPESQVTEIDKSVLMTEKPEIQTTQTPENNGKKILPGENRDFYPDTEAGPVLELTWDGKFDPRSSTRFMPFGAWEGRTQTPQGIAYQPAPEMEFHYNSKEINFLAVAPGTVIDVSFGDASKANSTGMITVRYGKNFSVIYYHIAPDSALKKGQRIETGQKIGTMPASVHKIWGEEVMWEISLIRYFPETGLTRFVPPYDYFSEESKALLDEIAANSKEKAPNGTGPNPWTLTTGSSWVKYAGKAEWPASPEALGYIPEGAKRESYEEFIRSMNPEWIILERDGIIGPTD